MDAGENGANESNPPDRCLLVVEDHEDSACFLSHWLKRRGVKSVLAQSGQEAMELVRNAGLMGATFDALLTDYRLPDATGCRIVRAFSEEFPGKPIALMTAYHDLTLEIWIHAKRIPLFRKPIELPELEDWLSKHADRADSRSSTESLPVAPA